MSSTFASDNNIHEIDYYIDKRQKKREKKANRRNQQSGLLLNEISPLNEYAG